jgi:uncharacterized protein (TIGR03083 family)
VFSALTRAGDDVEVWTWTGANQPVAWVERRMAQETAVHRWDAANAVGLPYDIPTAVAADGIDEFLTWFASRRVARAPRRSAAPCTCTAPTPTTDVTEGSDDRAPRPASGW